MSNTNELNRMKALMNYGLQTENKEYSSVEYSKVGADGKLYGIVREGAKYYIKVSENAKKTLKENFDYIGGFSNRKDHEYTSYANALKQFDLKMMSLKEAASNGSNIIIESWNPDKNEELAVESTQKMRKEIMRQRQIMSKANMIQEGKCCEDNAPYTCDADKEYKVGDGKKTECKPNMCKNTDNGTCAEVTESTEVLAWHDTKDTKTDTFMDTSKGTEIGDSAPFDKGLNTNGDEADNGVVEECDSMHNSDNQNSPSVGTSEVGDTAPFTEKKGKLDEELDDLGDSASLNDSDTYDAEYDVNEDDEDSPIDYAEGDDAPSDVDLDTYEDLNGDEDIDADAETDDLDVASEGEDVNARLDSIESMLNTLMDKIDSMSTDGGYDDKPLYDDDAEGEDLDGEDFDMENEPLDDDTLGDDDEDAEIYESKSYRAWKKRINEEQKLDYFGKHPAYRKEPMTLPTTGEDKNAHGEDWNDDSVHNEKPYGEKIGSSAPFEITPTELENSIAEAIKRILGNRIKL